MHSALHANIDTKYNAGLYLLFYILFLIFFDLLFHVLVIMFNYYWYIIVLEYFYNKNFVSTIFVSFWYLFYTCNTLA